MATSLPLYPSNSQSFVTGLRAIALRSPSLKKVVGNQITKKKAELCDLRGKLQHQIDNVDVSG